MQEHHREIHLVQMMELTMVKAVCEDQQAVGVVFAERAAGGSLFSCGVDEQVIPRLIGPCFNAFQHRRKERAADLGQHQTNGVGPSAGKDARRMAWDELQFLHGEADSICFFRLDRRCPVQDAAYGGDRNIRMAGDIGNRRGTAFVHQTEIF